MDGLTRKAGTKTQGQRDCMGMLKYSITTRVIILEVDYSAVETIKFKCSNGLWKGKLKLIAMRPDTLKPKVRETALNYEGKSVQLK